MNGVLSTSKSWLGCVLWLHKVFWWEGNSVLFWKLLASLKLFQKENVIKEIHSDSRLQKRTGMCCPHSTGRRDCHVAGSAPQCPSASCGHSVHAPRYWQTYAVHLAESAKPAYFFIASHTLLGFNATGNRYKHECNKNNHTQ